MTTAISAPINTATASYASANKPSVASEPEEIEHPFADIDHNFEAETILASEAEKVWSDDKSTDLFGKDGFTFGDFLDIINPLQHIPVIANIYRSISGDGIEPGSRIAGGALFGGGLGLAGALINAVIEDSTGKDLGDHALAMIESDTFSNQNTTGQVAAAQASSSKSISGTASTAATTAINSPTLVNQNDPKIRNGRKSILFDRAPAVAVKTARGQAFGGIMMPPNGNAPIAQTNEAAATDALLNARSAVPSASVSNLKGRSSTNRIAYGAGPKTFGGNDAKPIVNPKDPIAFLPSIEARLNTLSQKSTAYKTTKSLQQSNPKNILPTRLQNPDGETNNFNNVTASAPLPNVMLDALDKYEMMMRERRQKNG
ncbi:MAG: hypothetical protein CMM76_01645 [Rhodospirillaceae bacterium]|nr:hypothetical protein [Rhodospirillaceae bacterium]